MQDGKVDDAMATGVDAASRESQVEKRRREILGKLALGVFVAPASLGLLARKRAFVSV